MIEWWIALAGVVAQAAAVVGFFGALVFAPGFAQRCMYWLVGGFVGLEVAATLTALAGLLMLAY